MKTQEDCPKGVPRGLDGGGNVVPIEKDVCVRLGCRDYKAIWVDQEPEPISRCLRED